MQLSKFTATYLALIFNEESIPDSFYEKYKENIESDLKQALEREFSEFSKEVPHYDNCMKAIVKVSFKKEGASKKITPAFDLLAKNENANMNVDPNNNNLTPPS